MSDVSVQLEDLRENLFPYTGCSPTYNVAPEVRSRFSCSVEQAEVGAGPAGLLKAGRPRSCSCCRGGKRTRPIYPVMLCSIAYFGQVCRASCLLAAQAATCCGQDKILVSKGKFANLSYVSTPEAPEGADSLEIHDPTLLCNALDPEIQVLKTAFCSHAQPLNPAHAQPSAPSFAPRLNDSAVPARCAAGRATVPEGPCAQSCFQEQVRKMADGEICGNGAQGMASTYFLGLFYKSNLYDERSVLRQSDTAIPGLSLMENKVR